MTAATVATLPMLGSCACCLHVCIVAFTLTLLYSGHQTSACLCVACNWRYCNARVSSQEQNCTCLLYSPCTCVGPT